MLEAEAKERQRQGVQVFAHPDEAGRARDKAAEITQTNRQYVSDAKKLQREAPDLLGQVKDGEITIPKAKEKLAYRQGDAHTMQVMGSSESSEWYTPSHIIELTLELFNGAIDTDPCSNSKSNPNVPARNLYTKDDDGLAQTWYGSVYMNPPYGVEIPADLSLWKPIW